MIYPFVSCTYLAVVLACAPSVCAQVPSEPPAQRQDSAKDAHERQRVLELYHAGKFLEVMPLLEKLAVDDPSDTVILEAWAYSIAEYSATLSDPEIRKKARARARALALRAQQKGDNSSLLQSILDIPEDGSEPAYSNRKDVDEAMRAAEADFARGDFEKARQGYLRASILDPGNYEAALFIGDVYFRQHVNGSAGEWFARAIQIDPNRETAYRYWGDALWDMGNSAAAREKYIEAIIAEPYNRNSLVGLNQWAGRTKVQLTWVRLQDKSKVEAGDKDSTITLDASLHDTTALAAWMAYSATRLNWQREKFKKEFPNEPKYRRTLREEVEALHLMVTVLSDSKDTKNLDPMLAALVKIDHAGFIEPFALLNRADNEIAQDYAAYRTANRDKLHRYFDEFVVPKAAANPAP